MLDKIRFGIVWMFVAIAWWLPGRPHRWSCRLKAERAAMLQCAKAQRRLYT
jgi:hypothetical protein